MVRGGSSAGRGRGNGTRRGQGGGDDVAAHEHGNKRRRSQGSKSVGVKAETPASAPAASSLDGNINPCLVGVNADLLSEMSEAMNRIQAEPILATLIGESTLTIGEGGRHAPFNLSDLNAALQRAEYSDSPFYVAGVTCWF